MKKVNKKATKKINVAEVLSYAGTIALMTSPYLLQKGITGYILGAVGAAAIIPTCIVHKQWNLVVLNVCSTIGYLTNIF